MRHGWRRRLGLSFVALVGVCALAEGLARAAGAPQPYTATFKFDAVLGYSYVASQSVEFALGRDRYRVEFDEDAVIDRSGARPEAVVILGDGVVSGLELPREERLAALVAAGGGTGAVNLAVPGYGLLQEVLGLERWLGTHDRPRLVVVVQNFANDLIDNVPEWEGTSAIPGIRRKSPSELELVPPTLRSGAYRWLASIAKTSRFYGASETLRSRVHQAGLAAQQVWLYAKEPPPELERGLDALRWSGRRLQMLAERYQFSVVVIDWVDWPLLWRAVDAPVEQQRLARARVQQATGFGSWLLQAPIPDGAQQLAHWDRQWVIEANRHANAAGILAVSQAIVDRLRAINE
jgi:hypothetical protein